MPHRGEAGRRHGGHLAVVEHRDGGRVAYDRGEVRGDVHLLVTDADHERRTAEVRQVLLGHRDLVGVPMAWASGLILAYDPARPSRFLAEMGIGARGQPPARPR